jgi:S1-C subfamily serine protease
MEAYRKASPGVVHIRSVAVRYGFFFQPVPAQGTGSGVVLDKKGYIMTNSHVVRDARSIVVTLADGTQWEGKLVGDIPEVDLALLKIEAPEDLLHPIQWGSSRELRVGQKVLAIGNPFGLRHSLTTGIISSLNRELMTSKGGRIRGLIQTDAAINPGNSGGPLLDTSGRLIGINTAILTPSGGSVGVGFAIPVETLHKNLKRLKGGSASLFSLARVLILLAVVAVVVRLIQLRKVGYRW